MLQWFDDDDALVIRFVSHLIFIEKITSYDLINSLSVTFDKRRYTILGVVT